jgi:hypothetical protein
MDLNELIEEAFERAGGEVRSGYDFRTARRSLNILLAEWSNRGINMWTIDSGTIPLISGTATYNLPADTVDLIEHVVRTGSGTTQADLTASRISVSTYATIPNKTATGRPLQIYIDRAVATPTVTVWPVPDASSTYTLVYWRMRRMDDAGNGTNTQEVPFRFLPCLVAGLAFYIALKLPEGQAKAMMLKQEYEEAWMLASTEDREKATSRFVPRIARV